MNDTAISNREDIRPVVPLERAGNAGLYAFAVVLVIGGAWLFSALSANRAEVSAPATSVSLDQPDARIASPPPLALPPGYETEAAAGSRPMSPGRAALPPPSAPAVSAAPAVVVRRVEPDQGTLPLPVVQPAGAAPARPSVVFDTTFGSSETLVPSSRAGGITAGGAGTDRAGSGAERVTASRLANPSRTVPRGTVIQAVLETALDSTRPGAARALVQRDIHSFDGSRVLIPRGSRLYGEYAADLSGGQRRAAIQWTRLLRPDGVTIELDSPASDPLGRAGVGGKVDTKFFERFGGAILQSVLDIGVGVATRKATDGVIVALPGSTQNLQITDQQRIQPTLKVRQGTSVSVFVARDLDFSTVDP